MFGSNCRREDAIGDIKVRRLSKPSTTTPTAASQTELVAQNGSSPTTENYSPRMRAPSSPPLAGTSQNSTPSSPSIKSPHKRTISDTNFTATISNSSSSPNFSEKQNYSTNTLNELYVAATDYIESFSPRPSNASDQPYSGIEVSTSISAPNSSTRRFSVTDEIFNLQSSSQPTLHISAATDKIEKPKQKSVRLDKHELAKLKEYFHKLDTSKKDQRISKADFRKCLGLLALEDDYSLSDFLFAAFCSKHKEDYINYKEFLTNMSILMCGSFDDRLEFAFKMIDSDGDGVVSINELEMFITAIHKVILSMNLSVDRFLSPMEYSMLIFEKLDLDKRGTITLQEYKIGAKKDPIFFKSLGLVQTAPSSSSEAKLVTDIVATDKNVGDQIIEEITLKGGKLVVWGSKKWAIVMNMMLGIRLGSEMTGEIKRDVRKEDFSVRLSFDLPKVADSNEAVTFIDYAPLVFKKIRQMSNINEIEYMLSLGPEQLLGSFLLGRISTLTEKISDGRSGSFFFYSHDSKFMVKTIPKSEASVLKAILPDYFYHLKDHPNSLIVRIFGFHEMQDLLFVVLGNVFDPSKQLETIYDMKGSTLGRSNPTGFVKKDLDVKAPFDFGPEKRDEVVQILRQDSEFLSKLGLIDYSFLVGIYRASKNRGRFEETRKNTLVREIPSVKDPDVHYLIGLIDIFTEYNTRKEAELIAKSVLHFAERKGISCQPPNLYSKRFVEYMEKIII